MSVNPSPAMYTSHYWESYRAACQRLRKAPHAKDVGVQISYLAEGLDIGLLALASDQALINTRLKRIEDVVGLPPLYERNAEPSRLNRFA